MITSVPLILLPKYNSSKVVTNFYYYWVKPLSTELTLTSWGLITLYTWLQNFVVGYIKQLPAPLGSVQLFDKTTTYSNLLKLL